MCLVSCVWSFRLISEQLFMSSQKESTVDHLNMSLPVNCLPCVLLCVALSLYQKAGDMVSLETMFTGNAIKCLSSVSVPGEDYKPRPFDPKDLKWILLIATGVSILFLSVCWCTCYPKFKDVCMRANERRDSSRHLSDTRTHSASRTSLSVPLNACHNQRHKSLILLTGKDVEGIIPDSRIRGSSVG